MYNFIMEDIYNYTSGSGIYVQVGAGAGDKDQRSNYRDGFTEFVKKIPKDRVKKIILVEPNPINIPFLRECWKDYPEVYIYEFAIVPENIKDKYIDLYYSIYDGPNYQVASIVKQHVLNHYRNDDTIIASFLVPTININDFLNKYVGNDKIDLLSLDIEGIDTEIVLELNLDNVNIKYLSFEYIHMGDKLVYVKKHLECNNYNYVGLGADYNGFDYLYKK
jgi:FkbM family methyltransferase